MEQNEPMKGMLYASIWCSAPGSGAYTPTGTSQYNRFVASRETAGNTPVQGRQKGQRGYLFGGLTKGEC
jgi:hypothetical protein